MDNVVDMMQRATDARRTATDRGRTDNDLAPKIEAIVKAIDKQKAEIAVFRQRMEALRTEMTSLDKSVATYRRRVEGIPHKALNRQARYLVTLMNRRSSHLS